MARRCSEHRTVISFASGPAVLPPEVLSEVQEAVGAWDGSGQSVLELPFGGPDYATIQSEFEAEARALLSLPPTYKILLLQGGAFAQFRLVPLNLLRSTDRAAYVETGYWSARAIAEAREVCRVAVVAQADAAIPPVATWQLPRDTVYCHVTGNETADGVQMHRFPALGEVPLVADLTADLFTGPIDIQPFGVIYASAQKNLGAPGLTVVIVREDLLGRVRAEVPAPFDYTRQASTGSRVNTPPIFSVFVASRMLKWLGRQGGLTAAAARCERRSRMLYHVIDASQLYTCPVRAADRSRISVCFHLPDAAQDAAFLAEAQRRGLWHLAGHPTRGGIRACLYNAMPESSVALLADFMHDFDKSYPGLT